MAATKSIKKQLTLATGALLAHEAIAEENEKGLYSPWDVDVGYMRYEEPDYITVDTYMAFLSGNISDDDIISLGLVFDTLTGATPTGALIGDEFTSVSGVSGGGVSTDSGSNGKVSFDDTRLAIDANWTHDWKRLIRSKTGAYVSVEGDYTAIGGSIAIEKDNEDKSLTYTAAIGGARDKVGQSSEKTPEPLTEIENGVTLGTGDKNTYDVLFGVTGVINRYTQGMLNFSYSRSLGYHTDPYKIISVADASDTELTKIFEKRPDERERYIIYSKLTHEIPSSGHHIAMSYRFHTDNWNINSHTLEGSYSWVHDNNHLFEPFLRLYHQTAADFYMRTVEYDGTGSFDTVVLPTYASSDARLAESINTTLGMKYKYKTSEKHSFDIRAGYYLRDFSNAIISEDGAYFVQFNFGKGFD